MKISLGTDHAGFTYKEVKQFLQSLGHEVVDYGTNSTDSVDYPTFIRPAALAVATGSCERGIVFGGSGNGEAMAANRIKGIRCAPLLERRKHRLARLHNDANMISIGERMMSRQTALDIVRMWLDTPFEGGRHVRRIQLLDQQ